MISQKYLVEKVSTCLRDNSSCAWKDIALHGTLGWGTSPALGTQVPMVPNHCWQNNGFPSVSVARGPAAHHGASAPPSQCPAQQGRPGGRQLPQARGQRCLFRGLCVGWDASLHLPQNPQMGEHRSPQALKSRRVQRSPTPVRGQQEGQSCRTDNRRPPERGRKPFHPLLVRLPRRTQVHDFSVRSSCCVHV